MIRHVIVQSGLNADECYLPTDPSTTATVFVPARCWKRLERSGRMEHGTDAGPQAVLVPTAIPTVERMPGAVLGRHLAPGGTGVHDPEQAFQQTAVVQRRAAARRLAAGAGAEGRRARRAIWPRRAVAWWCRRQRDQRTRSRRRAASGSASNWSTRRTSGTVSGTSWASGPPVPPLSRPGSLRR